MNRVVATVRRATAPDAPAIQGLQKRWARENITHGFRPASLAAVRKALDGWCYVAETDGQIIVFVAVILGAANVTGGYVITERILQMFDQGKRRGN